MKHEESEKLLFLNGRNKFFMLHSSFFIFLYTFAA